MTARDEVVATLAAEAGPGLPLAGVAVIAYARNIDPPQVPTVLVRVDEVSPSVPSRDNPIPNAWRTYGFALVLVPSTSEPGTADDELDALLEDVLYAIDQHDRLTWTKATRGTYQDTTYPAYEVALTVPFTKE